MSRAPKFRTAAFFLDDSLIALGRAAAHLEIAGQAKQHPMYYRANQFRRQLEEFRVEVYRAARAGSDPEEEPEPARAPHPLDSWLGVLRRAR